MKEFNLEEALAGKPVKLRNGDKAYVIKHILNPTNKNYALIGYREHANNGKEEPLSWDVSGKYFHNYQQNADIVGMWEETIRIGDIDVPKPETTEPEVDTIFYVPSLEYPLGYVRSRWCKDNIDYERLEKGLVHLSKEAAAAHSEALLALTKEAISCTD